MVIIGKDCVTRDDFLFETVPPVDLNATYAAYVHNEYENGRIITSFIPSALAVGKTKGVARGAHLEAITIMDQRANRARSSDITAAIDKILSACGNGQVICIVALPHVFGVTMDNLVTKSIQKLIDAKIHVVSRAGEHEVSKDVVRVAPASNHNLRMTLRKGLFVDMWVPAFPMLEEEGNVEIDMWLAAVMRAAGVTASFVSWYWNEKHEKPEPAFIKRRMLKAVLLSSFKLHMIHVPNTVSGKPAPAIPNQLPSTGKASHRKRPINDQQSQGRRVRNAPGTTQRSEDRNVLNGMEHSTKHPQENHSPVNSQSSPAVLHDTDSSLIPHPAVTAFEGYPEYTYSLLNIATGNTNSPSNRETGVED
ncbi:hypothetical protein H0H93_016480 [Arthromyces matolae]|nr:hypothetical protein H0H93_016480 [Arthromyces matolae]